MDILFFTQPGAGNFLVKLISILIQFSSSIALGVVLFTLILKLLTLPFDYISRASMRKNSLKMEQMRPELEKLQQQYANDKNLYQQKMMALYKKNGYSMFGSCLPTILTLIIFIVAINGFTNYSKIQNKEYFYNMTTAYNNVVYAGMDLDAQDTKYIIRNEKGELHFDGNALYAKYNEGLTELETKNANGETFKIYLAVEQTGVSAIEENGNKIGDRTDYKLHVHTENAYVKASLNFSKYDYIDEAKADETKFTNTYYNVIEEKLEANKLACEENNYLKIQPLNEDGSFKLDENGNKIEKTYLEAKAENAELTATAFILDIRQQKSADKFREEQASFLWVKNIWVSDSPFQHPVGEDWNEFKTTHSYDGNDIGEEGYASLTKKLAYEKSAPNGYFILVALTALSSLVTQLVMGKSQKAQMELQTVDGRGAQTQKTMMIVMPIMMAIFAFMYTSAFSIYIVLSSAISMLTTVLINKIVDFKFRKETGENNKPKKIRGRVYTPKQEEKKEEPKAKKAKGVENQHGDNDFMSGKADGKKKIRGRIK